MDTVDRMIRDALQDMAQVEFGVNLVEFGRTEQAVNGRCAFAAGIRAWIDSRQAIWSGISFIQIHFTSAITGSKSMEFLEGEEGSVRCPTWHLTRANVRYHGLIP